MINFSLSNHGYSRRYHRDWVSMLFEESGIKEPSKRANWCGVYMAHVARRNCSAILHVDIPMNPQVARNWQKVGKHIGEPELGDIVIFWREHKFESWKGHVGLFVNNHPGGIISVLGGNQGGASQVTVSKYSTDRVLGYRRL